MLNKEKVSDTVLGSSVYLAAGPVQASQWGLALSKTGPVWVEQWRSWLLEAASQAGGHSFISARQSRALWNQIVTASAAGQQLIDAGSIAQWAAAAWSLIRQYQIPVDAVPRSTPDLRALVGWGQAYDDHLDTHAWADPDHVAEYLKTNPVQPRAGRQRIVLLDLSEFSPSEQDCLSALKAAGWTLEQRGLASSDESPRIIAASDDEDELLSAVDWALDGIKTRPKSRIALVIPSAYASRARIERLLMGQCEFGFAAGKAPVDEPAIAAAAQALELLGPGGTMAQLSAWLRSPFYQGVEPTELAAAARVEITLRSELLSQVPLHTAYRSAGLERLLDEAAPRAAARLARALACMPKWGALLSVGQWIEIWQDSLACLEWLRDYQPIQKNAAAALESAFREFGLLSPVLGQIGYGTAISELQRILAQPLLGERLPVAGVHVLNHIDELGPGYDAIWALGFSDVAWPQRRAVNPFLPRRLQIEYALPWASPQDCLRRSRRSIARIAGCAPEVVLSWPRRQGDSETRASELLAAYALSDSGALENDGRSGQEKTESVTGSFSASETTSRFELVELDDVPPAFTGQGLPGGAGMLNIQSTCPVTAFINYRLHALELEAWTRGVAPRLRGILLHRAADQLLPTGTTREAIESWGDAACRDAVHGASRRVLLSSFGACVKPLATLFGLELQRMELTLLRLLETELARAPFRVGAVEQGVRIAIDERYVSGRIDRIDKLADGSVAIIDYKTGAQSRPPQWFGETVSDFQVPLYTLAVGTELSAVALCRLSPERCDYRGYWQNADDFPGKPERLFNGQDWDAQRSQWAEQIAMHARAFALGDTRIAVLNSGPAEGAYAPLTRVYELFEAMGGLSPT